MDGNNKPNLLITEPEAMPESYDFDFIAATLGLMPYQAIGIDDKTTFQGALNPGAIINLEDTGDGNVAFTLHGGEEIVMNACHMAHFARTLKRQLEERRKATDAEIKRQAELRIHSEMNAANQAMANAAMMGKLKGMRRPT